MAAYTRYSLLGGLGLILAANAVALSGVWYNRSGTPDAVLNLSERELWIPSSYSPEHENSGLALRLNWGVKKARAYNAHDASGWYPGEGDWLDSAKLEALGIHVGPRAAGSGALRPKGDYLPADVLLVLELDGAAYREHVERLCQIAADAPADSYKDTACKSAKTQDPRLLVVDAGLDHDSLRRQYPDTSMYAIVHGRIMAGYLTRPVPKTFASIAGLAVDEINVPLAMNGDLSERRSALANGSKPQVLPLEAKVAFGQRLEPWLLSLTTRDNRAEEPSPEPPAPTGK